MDKNKNRYVHLHVHTEYSVLDGLNKVKLLIDRVKALGMSACAITDHGTLSGLIEFYKACKAAEIKPILGMEAYITIDEDDWPNEKKTRDNRHLVLLAMNNVGLKNLIWLNNRAHLHNFYYSPRICLEHLKTHSTGLVALTACLGGVAGKKAIYKQDNELEQIGLIYHKDTESVDDLWKRSEWWIEELSNIFRGKLYLEIQDHPNWEQKAYNRWLKQMAEQRELPMVLTCDAHYPRPEDLEVHQLLMAQQFKMTLPEYKAKDSFELKNFIREPEELYQFSAEFKAEEAFWNTAEIAEQCNVTLELGKYQTPLFDVTKCEDYKDFQKWTSLKQSHGAT